MTSINSGQRHTWPKKVPVQMGADLDLGDGTYEDFFCTCTIYILDFYHIAYSLHTKSKEKHFCQHQYVNGYDKNALRFK